LTLLTIPDTTIQDIPKILTDASWRIFVIQNLDDPYLSEFWEKELVKNPARLQQEAISPILNKVGQYIAHPLVRNIVGYPEDVLNFDEIVNEGKILIVNLPKGQIGEDAVLMLGTALLTRIQLAVLKRSAIPEQQR